MESGEPGAEDFRRICPAQIQQSGQLQGELLAGQLEQPFLQKSHRVVFPAGSRSAELDNPIGGKRPAP